MGIHEISHPHPTSPPMEATQAPSRVGYLVVKRCLDILLASIALLALFPLFLIIALAVKLDSQGPVIYVQKRVRGNQDPQGPHPERNVFPFYKFRSMYVNSDARIHQQYMSEYIRGNHGKINNGTSHSPVYKMKQDPRITRVGRFLRRTSLDELPQLINVLKGDMSLVGPRPALVYEVEQYDHFGRQRLCAQAGITGLWQVSGRTCLTFEEMVQLDIEYTQRCSLWLDIRILFKTIPAVLSGDGAW